MCRKSNKIYCDKISTAHYLLTVLKWVALWSYDCQNQNEKKIKSKIRFIQHLVIQIPFTLTFSALMWIEGLTAPDLDQAGGIIYMTLAITLYIVKYVNIIALSNKAYTFFHELQHNTNFNILTSDEAEMWSKEQRKFLFVCLIYISFSLLSGFVGHVGALFSKEYTLAFPYYIPFDWRNPERYWFVYFYDVICIFFVCLSNTTLDMLGCYMMFHIGLLYKLLGLRLIGMKSAMEEDAMRELRKLYVMHSHIKKMTKECEVLISYYVMSQILVSALIIGFSGYRVQKMDIVAEFTQFFSMLQFVSVMILEIYLPCHYANQVHENSSKLLYNIYDCDWYKYDLRNQRFIFLYMQFFKEPVQLRAGKYFAMGLPIFTKVMNNSYSYFALLLNMDK